MEAKKIKTIVQAALDEYCAIQRIKKITIKTVDVENRLDNPCSHDDFIDVKAKLKERIGMKIFCSMVDYLRIA